MSAAKKLLNLTPHDVCIIADNCVVTYPKVENGVARMSSDPQEDDAAMSEKYGGVPIVTAQRFIDVEYPAMYLNADGQFTLPEGCTGILVSMPIGEHLRRVHNTDGLSIPFDVLGPDMSPAAAIRGKDSGQPIGTKRLCLYVKGGAALPPLNPPCCLGSVVNKDYREWA